MRAKVLDALVEQTQPPRRSLLTFMPEERQRYVDAWDRVDRHQKAPHTLTRAELNGYQDDVKLLTTCASCGDQATGSTHFPDDPAFEIPVCLQCLQSPEKGE